MPAEVMPQVPWAQLSAFIAEKMGLHFPPERFTDLQRGLGAAAQEAGFDNLGDFSHWLLSTPISGPQLHALASHLTVGETYFFREPKTFAALAERVLPRLLDRRRGERRLRVWSAACCSGEEAYSIAILLQQSIPDWRDWHITLLATDINERFLKKAAAGVYGEWSFRDPPVGLKERYFTRTPEGRYALLPQVKQMVTFAPLNLAEDRLPSLATQTQAIDLIFCRNVLMYFTPAQAHKVVEKLHRALREDGWLVTSPSESSRALFFAFEPTDEPGAVFYRKKGIEPPVAAAPSIFVPGESFEPTTPTAPVEIPTAPMVAEPPPPFSVQARALANEGQLDRALKACDRWIAAEPLDAGARYLRAVVLQELGNLEEARRSLQHTLYLEPGFVLAVVGLGHLARGAGKHLEAHRHFSQALTLLRDRAADEPLPESDGLTAGRLREILSSLLAIETAA